MEKAKNPAQMKKAKTSAKKCKSRETAFKLASNELTFPSEEGKLRCEGNVYQEYTNHHSPLFIQAMLMLVKMESKKIVTPKLIDDEADEELHKILPRLYLPLCECCGGLQEDKGYGEGFDLRDKSVDDFVLVRGAFNDMCGECDVDCGRDSDDEEEGECVERDKAICVNPKNVGALFWLFQMRHIETLNLFNEALHMDSTRNLNEDFFATEPVDLSLEPNDWRRLPVHGVNYLARVRDLLKDEKNEDFSTCNSVSNFVSRFIFEF